ncbi:hypothetical protein [Bradyrhizobium sp.]|uniref:hypothetical protein n=1 Tax=Bradyrhizobium sp. TaxID=376 RepID=UPI0039E6E7FA
MSEMHIVAPKVAAKLIRPGAVKTVRILFQARGGRVALLTAPKSQVQWMLRQLPDDAEILVEIMKGLQTATIAGAIAHPLRSGEVSEAASIVRRMS